MLKELQMFPGYAISDDGYVVNMLTGKVHKGSVKKTGYVEVNMRNLAGKKKSVLLHRLVALNFCERNEWQTEVNHIDGDKTNNRAENLEWISHADNLKHAYEADLRENDVSPRSVIAQSMDTGEEIEFSSIYKAARFFGISKGNICSCCQGKRPYANGYYWRYANGGNQNE